MATIQMVSRLDEIQGVTLATALTQTDGTVTAVCWWVSEENDAPRLIVGYSEYRSEGPRATVDRLSRVQIQLSEHLLPDFLRTEAVASDDPRLQALARHPWSSVKLDSPDVTYRYVNVWSRETGAAQALVYFLKAEGEVLVPLPPALPQAA